MNKWQERNNWLEIKQLRRQLKRKQQNRKDWLSGIFLAFLTVAIVSGLTYLTWTAF
jgi:hypothetical protein